MIELDGALLGGTGMVLRAALGFSAYTNKSFRLTNIRADRPKPGLRPQHVAGIEMMRTLCNADVTGNHVGSTEITFRSHGFTPSAIDANIGTAGPVTLLLQSLLIPATHHKKTTYTLRGGTDVRWSPPIDFERNVIAPALTSYADIKIDLKRRGYYPKGGGHIELTLGKRQEPKPATYIERGSLQTITCICNASRNLIDKGVCEEVEKTVRVMLGDLGVPITVRNEYVNTLDDNFGITLYATHFLEEPRSLIGADILGDEAGSPSEAAETVCRQLRERLATEGVVDEHVADHLILFMALHGGEMIATKVSGHIISMIKVAEAFTSAKFSVNGNHITVSRLSTV